MENIDNKTQRLDKVDLLNFKKLIEDTPCHIATVRVDGRPNLAVVSDKKVLDSKTILISNNEMIHTPDNIDANENVVLTSFSADWEGVRLTGKAKCFYDGKYFEMCKKYFKDEKTNPKCAIVVEIACVESYK